ncbi:hypothetical protein FZC76_21490 [Sutcliffiella horikoshii]|uniref:Uncharacterized protein n=1 Tax=Sutcliffiella horikoshii TaxID=79883 RepID=A0A5D4SET1_9BACI|nr:hypothetical protein [Sutcliffiella horikoshii]TYS61793.1 hypothetical protein FZC76_21490 [Sutcliffiella horikoshii]
MLKTLSKMVTGLVKEMGSRREVVEVVPESPTVGVVPVSPMNMLGRQVLKLAINAEVMFRRAANESDNARNTMWRKQNMLAVIAQNMTEKEMIALTGMEATNESRKEKILAIIPNKAVGVKERIRHLTKRPINFLAEFKFALSLSSKKEVVGVNTS